MQISYQPERPVFREEEDLSVIKLGQLSVGMYRNFKIVAGERLLQKLFKSRVGKNLFPMEHIPLGDSK